jgi:hypothetical protein
MSLLVKRFNPLVRVALISASAIALLQLLMNSPPVEAATGRLKDNCAGKGSALGRILCQDPVLAEQERWAKHAFKDALVQARKSPAPVQKRHKQFLAERKACLPAPPVTEVSLEAEDAEVAKPPSGGPAQSGAGPAASPGHKKPAASPLQDEALNDDASGPQASPVQTIACLRKAYETYIEQLEQGLRRFADLSRVVPNATSVCTAVNILQRQRKPWLLTRHAIVIIPVDEAPEMHPSQKTAHLLRYMTKAAWSAAAAAVPTWNSALGAVTIARVPLTEGAPPEWLLTTLAGDGRDRDILLFAGDTAMADRLVGFVGGEGAGPFDPLFVRFKGVSFAIEQAKPPAAPAHSLRVYALDQSKPACGAGVAKGK